jgi:hypothetical protein
LQENDYPSLCRPKERGNQRLKRPQKQLQAQRDRPERGEYDLQTLLNQPNQFGGAEGPLGRLSSSISLMISRGNFAAFELRIGHNRATQQL